LQETPALPQAGQCIQFANQATFHPLKYLAALCDIIQKRGGKIYAKTHAKDINTEGIVTNELFRVNAKNVVVATNTPVNNLVVMHLKQYAYRSYVIGSLIPKGSLPDVLWWDTGDVNQNKNMPPYHYVRLHEYDQEHDLLICGGEDHPTGLADADDESEELKFGKLEAWAKEYFKINDIQYRWSGQVMEPMDSIAYIGRNPMDKDNVFIATGDSGNGMTHGTIAGLLISDLINGRKNEWEEIYDPSRFKLFKAGNVFFKEVVGGLVAYLKSKPGNTEATKLLQLPAGEGTIAELEGTKYGVYRDDAGTLHMVTAECTHLKCIVKFNNVEKSWDCPCHGSRFSYKGEVMNGPANQNLDYHSE
jgi:nitrite reductase/ring-hydroxylating ferredoxin subunit